MAIENAGFPRSRVNGLHGARHFRAPSWLAHGVNLKALPQYLDHADSGLTRRIYTHN